MLNNSYARAYTEVYEILNHLDQTEVSNIPKEEIDFIKENRDMDYEFKLDKDVDLNEYEFSRKTYSIIIYLYKEYIANSAEKVEIENQLNQNQRIIEDEKREKYNPDNIFKNNSNTIEKKNEESMGNIEETNRGLVEKSNSWIQKIKNVLVDLKEKIFKNRK